MEAWLYNSQNSSRSTVKLSFDETTLSIESEEGDRRYDLDSLTFSPRLANTPRLIYLPDNRVCETQENDAIDELLKHLGRSGGNHLLHFFESKLRYLFIALAVTGAFGYLFVVYALPVLAKKTAQELPASFVYRLGDSTLVTLDKTLLHPSKLPLKRQTELRDYFRHYSDSKQEWPKVQVLFRSSAEVGANAFALPDGSIVFTDDLISLAKDDKELLAIFFHELGHIQKRHALQSVLQNTAFYLLLSSITGDVTAAGSAFATLPTMLVESSYSRDMEIEADDYAYEMMKHHHIEHKFFVSMMSRLMEKNHESNSSAMGYISDHPLTQLRIERFQKGN